jgi:hypothetical protein
MKDEFEFNSLINGFKRSVVNNLVRWLYDTTR